MVDFMLYMVFSILEAGAMFYLMFKIFKIDLQPKEMLLSAAIMSFVSHTLRVVYELGTVDVAVQFLLMFCFTWMLFRIHVFYAAILTGMVYQAYFVIQTVYYFIFSQAGLFTSEIPVVTHNITYILQLVSAATALFTGWLLAKKRKGFDFVPDKPRGKLHLGRRDAVMLILTLPSFAVVLLTLYLTSSFGQEGYLAVPAVYAALLFGYLILSYQKDWDQEESLGA